MTTSGNDTGSNNLGTTPPFQDGRLAVACLSLLTLELHLLAAGQYGYHRDELYYIACGEHLDWGYVDHPPFTPLLANLSRLLWGDTLRGLRFFPAVAHAVIVLLMGSMVRALGGARWAQVLGAMTILIAPLYLSAGNLLQPVVFDQLVWALGVCLILRLLKTGDERLWLPVGLVAGAGLMNKNTVLLLGLGIGAGLLFTPAARRHLRSPWLWLGVLAALALFLPNLAWQVRHEWPTLEFYRNLNARTARDVSPLDFVLAQGFLIHPFTLPLWVTGLIGLLRGKHGEPFRVFGWMYVVLFVVLIAARGKPYYLGPAYPILLAAGAVATERWVARRGAMARGLRPALILGLAAGGIVSAPIVLPVLPPDVLVRLKLHEANQDFAEMLGWHELVATVAAARDGLSPEERAAASLFTANYGEASALNLMGRPYHLPQAISGHNSYHLWGAGSAQNQVVIALGFSERYLRTLFGTVTKVGTVHNKSGVANEEQGQFVYVCRKPKQPSWQKAWARTKHYN